MPATTVDDLTTLERIPAADRARSRRIRSLTTAPTGYEGDGFPVHRAFAGIDLADLDPFVHMDQMGEVEYAPGEPKGTSWHPHRGFETVTYMIDGTMEHQDSEGGGGVITNGDTQWMTAGSGLLHIERPPEALVASGGLFHGIQLWVNLPSGQKMATPRYQDLRSGEVALATTPDAGALVRVIAGNVAGQRGPGSTHTPMAMVHATVAPGAELVLPWPEEYNALAYVLAGVGDIGPDRRRIEAGQTVVFGPAGERASGAASPAGERASGAASPAGDGRSVAVSAAATQDSRTAALEVLFLGGRPIKEPVAWMGPFVMNTQDELRQAYEDFQAGRLGRAH